VNLYVCVCAGMSCFQTDGLHGTGGSHTHTHTHTHTLVLSITWGQWNTARYFGSLCRVKHTSLHVTDPKEAPKQTHTHTE